MQSQVEKFSGTHEWEQSVNGVLLFREPWQKIGSRKRVGQSGGVCQHWTQK